MNGNKGSGSCGVLKRAAVLLAVLVPVGLCGCAETLGAGAGAYAGNQFGKGSGKTAATVGGAVGGAVVGHEIAK
jgi:outer membrane lipoprotein SlyB